MDDTNIQVLKAPFKTGRNGKGEAAESHDDPAVPPMKAGGEEQRESPKSPLRPGKPTRRPWVWALLGAAVVAATAVGVAYYIHSLSFESTDDAFIDGHVVPVSSRVSGHVAKVCVDAAKNDRDPGWHGDPGPR